MLRVLAIAVLLVLPSTASAQAFRWVRRAPAREVVAREALYPNAELEAGNVVHVWVSDGADHPVFEARITSPHWTTPHGAECGAMGIAGVDLVQHGGHLDVRVEIAIGDLCETGAVHFAIVDTPLT